jgi:hypothetical protein
MPFNLKVGGAWKQGTGAQVKVGGAWKTVESIQVKVGGVWKVAFTNSITPTITAAVTPNPSAFTQDVTISGFVLPVPTGGTVLVRDIGSNPVGEEANVNTTTGAYSITIPDQPVGIYDFSVTYSGFDLYQEVFTNVSVNVGTIPTTTSIARSAATYVFNQTRVTLSGVVTPAPTSGTVAISSPTQGTIATVGVNASTGAYSVLVPVRDTGSYTNISALYSGGGNFAPSTSGTTSYSVTQATSTIFANTSSSSVQAGNTVTLSANLTTPPPPAAPGQVGTFVQQPLSGRSVTFQGLNSSSAWVNLGTGVTDSGGNATFTWTAVSGYTQIRAVYAGELNYEAQTSGNVAISIFTTIATTTSIARSAASYTFGGTRVTISGTVSPTPTGGTVTIRSGTTTLATATVNTSTGAYSAVMPVQDASATAYTVTASYGGFGGVYLASTSGSTSYTVNQVGTAVTNTGAFDVNNGAAVTLSTTLTAGGSAFSGQTITFQVLRSSDSVWVNAGTGTTNASGVASLSWTTGNAYSQSRAVYSGATNYASSVSAGVGFTTRGRVTTSITTSTAGSNWYFRGSIGSAQQVGTNITSPAAVSGANQYAVYRVDIAVSGINGRQGQAAACMWTSGNNGTLLRQGATKNLTSRADGSTNRESWTGSDFTAVSYTPDTVYKFGFWRRGNSTTFQTQWRQNNGTGRNTYWDNSASAPGTFDHDTTFTGHSLDMTVYYEYYTKNN